MDKVKVRFTREVKLGVATADGPSEVVFKADSEHEFDADHALLFVTSGDAQYVGDAEPKSEKKAAPRSRRSKVADEDAGE